MPYESVLFWIVAILLFVMPIRFAMAWMLYGFGGAVRLISGFWLGWLLFAGGGFLILLGTLQFLKLLPNVPLLGLLAPIIFIAGCLGYLWLLGLLLKQHERLRDRFRQHVPPTEEDIREAFRERKPVGDTTMLRDEILRDDYPKRR
jgi:hypothetical protein